MRSAGCCRRSGTPGADAACVSRISGISRPASNGRNRPAWPRRRAWRRLARRPRPNCPPGPATGPAAGPCPASGPDDAQALGEALDHIGETGAISLTEVFDGRIAGRQADAITARAHLETELREIRERLAGLRAERRRDRRGAGRRAARQRPAPGLRGTVGRARRSGSSSVRRRDRRRRGRRGRGRALRGGPADRLDPPRPGPDRSGAGRRRGGRLPAPVGPRRPAARSPASSSRGAGPRPRGRGHRGAPLRSHSLATSPAAAHGDATAERSRRSAPRPSSATAFTSAPGPKAAPEYIGATQPGRPPPRPARRIRRADRRHQRQRGAASRPQDRTSALLEDFQRARRELPDTRPIATARRGRRHPRRAARPRPGGDRGGPDRP